MIEGVDGGVCLHGMFRESAGKFPDRTAVMAHSDEAKGEMVRFTYKELDRGTDNLASQLINMGVVTDDIVGILMPRNASYAFAYVAALKAGGAYLPLDPGYPVNMLKDVLVDATPRVIFATESEAKKIAVVAAHHHPQRRHCSRSVTRGRRRKGLSRAGCRQQR